MYLKRVPDDDVRRPTLSGLYDKRLTRGLSRRQIYTTHP